MTCNEMNGLQLHVIARMNLSKITLNLKKHQRQFYMGQLIENNIQLRTHLKCMKHMHAHSQSKDEIKNS